MKQFSKHFIFTAFIISCVTLFVSSCDMRQKEKEKPRKPAIETPVPVLHTQEDIYNSIRNGDTTAFMAWLFDKPELDRQNEETGQTALMIASEWNRILFVKDLIEQGANPNIQDGAGRTALHTAALSNHIDVIRQLLTSSINPTLTDADGLTAKDLAAMRGNERSAALLSEAIDAYLTVDSITTDIQGKDDTEIDEIVLLSTDFRIWTSASGDKLDAAFIQTVFDSVVLQARDGKMLRIAINRLSPSDQILVRKLSGIDPHALASARKSNTSSARRTASESLAARIGNENGWTILENCRLLSNSSNDGDSFHVKHDGKEYIFRLYFVDATETDNSYPDRIRDQSRYFKISEQDTLKLGKEAAKYTTSILAGSPFTVYTKWIDARGNSQLKRHFAMVETSLGDLDELLTREGLVRQYGMQVEGGSGQKKSRRLSQLEAEARREKVGGWKEK